MSHYTHIIYLKHGKRKIIHSKVLIKSTLVTQYHKTRLKDSNGPHIRSSLWTKRPTYKLFAWTILRVMLAVVKSTQKKTLSQGIASEQQSHVHWTTTTNSLIHMLCLHCCHSTWHTSCTPILCLKGAVPRNTNCKYNDTNVQLNFCNISEKVIYCD